MAGWERERNRDDGPRAKQGGATKEMDVEGVEIVKGWRPVCGWVWCNTLGVTLYSLLLKHCMSIILMCKCMKYNV